MNTSKKEVQKNDKYTLTECNFNSFDELKTTGNIGFGCGCYPGNFGIYCG